MRSRVPPSRSSARLRLAGALALPLLLARAATAQQPAGPGAAGDSAAAAQPARVPRAAAVVGVIRGRGGEPLEGAELRVVGRDSTAARAGADGRYRLGNLAPGQYVLQARRLGYTPLTFTATLDPEAEREFDVELQRLPTALPAVVVRERSGFGGLAERRLRDFARRRRMASGRFLTRDDITRRYGVSLTLADVVRREAPFVAGCPNLMDPTRWAGDGWGGGGRGAWYGAARTAFGGGRCSVAVSVDGGPVMPGAENLSYPLQWVDAVEVYRGGVGVPLELTSGLAYGASTVVVIWTGVESDETP